jgi:dihydroorotase
MSMKTLIKNARIINEGKIFEGDVLIHNERIERIASEINEPHCTEIDAEGKILMPGMIDDQVHFREPGLTHKATIASESMAAVAGGITSYMDMPNTIPNTLTRELLEEKYQIAAASSIANYSFYMGISQTNMEEALRIDNETVCGITDDGLYFNQEGSILCNHPQFLAQLFARSEAMIALHCEDEPLIKRNTLQAKAHFGMEIPFNQHPFIRSVEACYNATKTVVELAQKHQNRVHIFHVSTAAETELFDHLTPIRNKRISAEACVHHLHFNDQRYDSLGSLIKWNPAIKSEQDRLGLIEALIANKLDIIATDHAPHTLTEKNQAYLSALSGGPLVQHALPAILELYHEGLLTLEQLVEKTSHNVAELYRMRERGYLREGYYADLVLVNTNAPWKVSTNNILSKCAWSPFTGQTFRSSIEKTFVNGNLVYDSGKTNHTTTGKRLTFEKHRI